MVVYYFGWFIIQINAELYYLLPIVCCRRERERTLRMLSKECQFF